MLENDKNVRLKCYFSEKSTILIYVFKVPPNGSVVSIRSTFLSK